MEPMGASAGCTDGGLTAADARATHDVLGETDAVDAASAAGSGVGSKLAVVVVASCSKLSIAAVCGSGGADCGGGGCGGTTKLSMKASSSDSTCVQRTRRASR